MSWFNRNVIGLGLTDLMADANYEMILAVLPLFLTAGLGAPAYSVGLVEGVADGAASVVKVASGIYSDRTLKRKAVGVGGYATTAAGFSLLILAATWPVALISRTVAWMGRGLRVPIRSAMLSASVEKKDLGKAFGFHEAMDTGGAVIGPAIALVLLQTHNGFRSVFVAAAVPAVLAVLLFALLPRDPRKTVASESKGVEALQPGFVRFLAAVGTFGLGNFAPAFLTLRAAQMLHDSPFASSSVVFAVGFYLLVNAIGALTIFPAARASDSLGKLPALVAAYALFGIACLAGLEGRGIEGVVLMAIPAGIGIPLAKSTESALAAELSHHELRGAAFGWLEGVNGVGDLISSVAAGLLWSWRGSGATMTYGLAFSAVAVVVLLVVTRPSIKVQS